MMIHSKTHISILPWQLFTKKRMAAIEDCKFAISNDDNLPWQKISNSRSMEYEIK